MKNTNEYKQEELRFNKIGNYAVRADFNGGGLSSDFGPLLLQGVDDQIGLTHRLAAALTDNRHQSYIKHTHKNLLAQRIYQIGCGYEDGNDANTLRNDPVFRLSTDRLPFDDKNALASGPTISRFEHAVKRREIYLICKALVMQFISSYSKPPETMILDLDHSEDQTHGQQPLAFYNHYYGSHCYLPLVIFEGNSGALVAAILRPGKRPTGAENAMIMKRVLKLIRKHFPDTKIVVRGDGHFSNPEMMKIIDAMPNTDFIFGMTGNSRLQKLAEPTKLRAIAAWVDAQTQAIVPDAVREYTEFNYAADTWAKPWRVLLKAEVMAIGENPRFVVTSLAGDDPKLLYEDLYCPRGQCENFIKYLKNDLASDRTSCTTFLANFMRLLLHAAAYILHHQLRTQGLQNTSLAQAQPSTVITKLFKIAVQVLEHKKKIHLHLPSACPYKELLHKLTERLFISKPARFVNSS